MIKSGKTGAMCKNYYSTLFARNAAGLPVKTLTGVSSIDFIGDGTPLIDYLIGGNMAQSGTPSSASPIYPNETGDRTANICVDYTFTTSTGQYYIVMRAKVNFEPDTTYKMSFDSPAGLQLYCNENLFNMAMITTVEGRNTITLKTKSSININNPQQGDGIRWVMMKNYITQSVTPQFENVMINLGGTALPYEPYGFKLPITCGTTQNIYLSEPIRKIGDYADIAGMSLGGANRRVKKLVLTGEESGWLNQYSPTVFELGIATVTISGVVSISSHFVFNPIQTGIVGGLGNGEYALKYFSTGTGIYIKDQDFSTVESWKSYLAQQYANGTPVTVWYVLASPQTETANMPQITTVRGNNTLSVGTTLPPASVSITGHIK